MFFTLAVSAATAEACAALTDRARVTDPRIMPIPGPAEIVWRAADGRAAILRWGSGAPPHAAAWPIALGSPDAAAKPVTQTASHAGTIWATADGNVSARTSLTRVDPVYVAEVPGAVVLSDRALWAAAVADRLGDHDPVLPCALLNTGYPLGGCTPFRGVSALRPAATARAASGRLTVESGEPSFQRGAQRGAQRARLRDRARYSDTDYAIEHALGGADGAASGADGADDAGGAGGTAGEAGGAGETAADVAAALVAAVTPLRAASEPVLLSLTGGKDSRLVAAALVAAGVPVRAKTHGFAAHPDVVVAADVARVLGIEHTVTEPAAPGQRTDVVGRLRATVLVADGMLSAFENVGRPDPALSPALTAGGHGGELLRGGYAEAAAGRRAAPLRAAEVLRRLTTRHLGLLRRGAAAGYVAGLASWSGAALARGPLQTLDDFYLVNRAGRWSAAARQAYLIRENLVQPLFDEAVVRAARSVPLPFRVSGGLTRAVLAELCPALADVPYAGKPAKGSVPVTFDWRRQYGTEIASFLQDYTVDLGAAGGLFDVVNRAAAEKVLTPPHEDRATVWALATLACLYSGDYRNARDQPALLSVS